MISQIISEKAILITGGVLGSEKIVQVFKPWDNTVCKLPSLPDKRVGHVQSGSTLCGGFYSRRSCIQWKVQNNKPGWDTLNVELKEDRTYSSLFRISEDNSLIIMGGDGTAKDTSERVSSDGESLESFPMRYPIK